MADCSSVDFNAKFIEETIKTPRIWLFFKIKTPSRMSSISKNCCVAKSIFKIILILFSNPKHKILNHKQIQNSNILNSKRARGLIYWLFSKIEANIFVNSIDSLIKSPFVFSFSFRGSDRFNQSLLSLDSFLQIFILMRKSFL